MLLLTLDADDFHPGPILAYIALGVAAALPAGATTAHPVAAAAVRRGDAVALPPLVAAAVAALEPSHASIEASCWTVTRSSAETVTCPSS